jgi:hypothetical protein
MRNLIAQSLRTLCLLLCCGFLVACSYDLRDDIDLTFNFAPLIGPSDSLHSPYVKGARFNIFLDDGSSPRHIGPGWGLMSADPTILSVTGSKTQDYETNGKNHTYLQATVAALEEGQTAIVVIDDSGSEVFRAGVEVLRPDRIDLLAHGPLLIERPADQAVTPAPQVLVGGTATFMARYFRGDRQLFGNGTLSVSTQNPMSLSAQVRQTFLFEDRDWLSITTMNEGATQLQLLAAGDSINQVTVTGVSEAALGQVRLSQADRVTAGDVPDGEMEVVLAETFNSQNQPIYGVDFNWTYGSDPQTGLGDLYRYQYKHGMRTQLSAQHGAMAANVMIEGKEGYVDSTNNIGCATTGRTGQGGRAGGFVGALLGLALVLLRMRRVRSF